MKGLPGKPRRLSITVPWLCHPVKRLQVPMESRGFGPGSGGAISGYRITALVLCVAVLGLGVWGAVAGIGALTGGKQSRVLLDGPSGTPFDITVQEPEGVDDVALQDYAQEYLNITMGIPQGYAETESGSGAFASSDGSATLQVGFYDKAAGFPVYTLSDVEENAEKYVQYYIGLLESTNITKHEILSRGYREGSSLDTYLIQFSATESGGTTMEFFGGVHRMPEWVGCYNLIGSYPQGDEKAQAEILQQWIPSEATVRRAQFTSDFMMKISRFNSSIGRTRARFSLLCSEKAG